MLVLAAVVATNAGALAQSPVGSEPLLPGHKRKLRPQSHSARALLDDGIARSATVRSLIVGLESTDVIVLIDRALTNNQRAFTSLMAAVPGARFIRVIVDNRLVRDRAVELLGHELQHVTEIASAIDVRSDADMRRHFETIGQQRDDGGFETVLAKQIEYRVHLDLVAASRRPRRTHHTSDPGAISMQSLPRIATGMSPR